MQVLMKRLDQIRPYENNPRKNESAIHAVARSIEEFGVRQPIVVDESGTIVVGHTRYFAAKKLGLEQFPVHFAKDLSPDKIRAYRVADNKLAEMAEWDFELLANELRELELAEIDIKLLGFSDDELAQLKGESITDGLVDPDSVPEPSDEPVTRTGDLWILGDHRLLCGDSSSQVDVDRLLDGKAVQLINTDPPYNVRVEPRSNNAIAAGNSSYTTSHHQSLDLKRDPQKARRTTQKLRAKDRPLANDFVSDAEFERLLRAWFGNLARALEPGRSFYIWGGYANCGNYPPALREAGLYFSQAVIWVKGHPVLTRKDMMGAHEWCFYGWREGAAHRFFGPANSTDVWNVKKVNPAQMIHLTEKPVELAVRAIQYSSRKGDRVLDLFGGSGSTLIAAEQTARRALLMEVDPAYCDVIVNRFEQFTGTKAHRETCKAGDDTQRRPRRKTTKSLVKRPSSDAADTPPALLARNKARTPAVTNGKTARHSSSKSA